MIYCTCGGQKNCFRCDGKGWLDEPRNQAEDNQVLPPVRKDLSEMHDSGIKLGYQGRQKALIAKVKPPGPIPRSLSNMEAARKKERKRRKELANAQAQAYSGVPTAPLRVESGRPGVKQKKTPESAKTLLLAFMSKELRQEIENHDVEMRRLKGGKKEDNLPPAILEKLQELKRAMRKVRSKARRDMRRQSPASTIVI